MNGRRRLIVLAAIGLAFASMGCGATRGLLRDSVTTVQLRQPNFKYVAKGLSANVQVHALFCTIPFKKAPYKDLMDELHQRANLTANQTLINFREDQAIRLFFGVWCYQEYTLTADVIEFMSTASPGGSGGR